MENVCPLVTIRCLAYNQEKYIRQCLDGFIMQKTNFPFEIVVHDDASTDETANIINEYARKYSCINAIIETENQYSKHDGSLARIVNKAVRGKYVALCEGDDYWTDALKLQKQVDFLESHGDYAMVYTRSKVYNQGKGQMEEYTLGNPYVNYDTLLCGNPIPSLTVCMRTSIMEEYWKDVKPYEQNWLMGDYPMWLWIAYYYKIKFFPEETTVYRVLEESASHSLDLRKTESFTLSTIAITEFYIAKFKLAYTRKYLEMINYFYYKLYDDYVHDRNYQKAKNYIKMIDTQYLPSRLRRKVRWFYLRLIKIQILHYFKNL